jgi:hypothetical protein
VGAVAALVTVNLSEDLYRGQAADGDVNSYIFPLSVDCTDPTGYERISGGFIQESYESPAYIS